MLEYPFFIRYRITPVPDVYHFIARLRVPEPVGVGADHPMFAGKNVVMFRLTLGSGDGTYRPVRVEGLAGDDAEDADPEITVLGGWRRGSETPRRKDLSWGIQAGWGRGNGAATPPPLDSRFRGNDGEGRRRVRMTEEEPPATKRPFADSKGHIVVAM